MKTTLRLKVNYLDAMLEIHPNCEDESLDLAFIEDMLLKHSIANVVESVQLVIKKILHETHRHDDYEVISTVVETYFKVGEEGYCPWGVMQLLLLSTMVMLSAKKINDDFHLDRHLYEQKPIWDFSSDGVFSKKEALQVVHAALDSFFGLITISERKSIIAELGEDFNARTVLESYRGKLAAQMQADALPNLHLTPNHVSG